MNANRRDHATPSNVHESVMFERAGESYQLGSSGACFAAVPRPRHISDTGGRRLPWWPVLAILGIAFAGAPPARADVRVTGGATEVTVEAHAATLSEVVAALQRQTSMHIEIAGGDTQPIDGSFRGSLEEVLADILRNTSFLVSDIGDKTRPGLRITLFGAVPR